MASSEFRRLTKIQFSVNFFGFFSVNVFVRSFRRLTSRGVLCLCLTPSRIRITPAERHEVREEQIATHGAFMASKARSADTARDYHRLWREVVGPFCRLFKCDPWALSGMQIANLLVWREMTGKAVTRG